MNWETFLVNEMTKPYYFEKIYQPVAEEDMKHTIYPAHEDRFRAFELTPFDNVQVVILGQDPYHSGCANGLAFSVNEDAAIPPSLRNIFKEIESDLGITCEKNGDLTRWAKQGVFLLNTALTVRAGEANSHKHIPWEFFTDNVFRALNEDMSPKVFMLWGKFAQRKHGLITNKQHTILEAAHPSPLSASRGFLGCRHFSLANEIFQEMGRREIDWR